VLSSLKQLLKLSIFGKIARFGGNYVLSWILFPEDFGILAVAVAYSQIILILRSSGLQAYFIQNYESERHKLTSTVFFSDLIMSSGLALIVALAAQGLIEFGYIQGAVRDIMLLMGLNIFVSGISNIYFFQLKKDLEFKTYSNITIGSDIFSTLSKIGLALLGFGAISFIFGELFGSVYKILFSVKFTRNNVALSSFDRTQVPKIVWYIKHSLVLSGALYIISNFDKLILYRISDLSELGKYTFAFAQIMMLFTFFVGPVNDLLFSLLPKVYGDNHGLNKITVNTQLLVTASMVPVFAFLIFNADFLVGSIYAERWSESVFFMRVFSTQFMIQCTFMCLMPIVVTQKRPDLSSKFKIVKALAIIVSTLVVYGITRTFVDVIYAFVLSSILADLVQCVYTVKKYKLDFKELLLTALILVSVAIVSSYSVRELFIRFVSESKELLQLLSVFAMFVLIYLAMIKVFFWKQIITSLKFVKYYK
jgi:O-antigen/teichoic acid export membrane protein